MRPLVLCGLVVLALLAGASHADEPIPDAPPTIYKWVDENGVAHYTTDRKRIPSGLRSQIGREQVQTAAPAPVEAAPAEGFVATEAATGTRVGAEPGFGRDASPVRTSEDGVGTDDFDDGGNRASELDAQIAALEAQIADDEGTLTSLVSGASEVVVAGDEEAALLRNLGDRLPKLLAELEELRAERETLAP